MSVTLLCIGDVVGRPGRYVLSQELPKLVSQYNIDCVIANVENAAGGSGLTAALYDKILKYGVHLMTLGDHIYKKRDILPVLERADNIVKPANLPDSAPGRTYAVWQADCGHRVAVICVLGQQFLRMPCGSPFGAVDNVLSLIPKDVNIVVVDVHAEATSEKVALGWHLDGRVSCVFGTHTHIPTADERILPKGTAYITDVGMTGPYDSVLGRRKECVVDTMRTCVPFPFDVASDGVALCGVLVRINPGTGKAEHVERIRVESEQPFSEFNRPHDG